MQSHKHEIHWHIFCTHTHTHIYIYIYIYIYSNTYSNTVNAKTPSCTDVQHRPLNGTITTIKEMSHLHDHHPWKATYVNKQSVNVPIKLRMLTVCTTKIPWLTRHKIWHSDDLQAHFYVIISWLVQWTVMSNTTELSATCNETATFSTLLPKVQWNSTAQQNAAVICSQNFNMLTVFSRKNNSLWLGSYLSDSWSCHRTLRLPVSLLRKLSRWQHEQDYTPIKQSTLQNPDW